jgi:hypothetical protein
VARASLAARAGNDRLHQRWQTFTARGKKPVIANVAVASGTGRMVLVRGSLLDD